jgi:hypothetical protein
LDRTFFDIKLNDQFGHVTAPMVLDGRVRLQKWSTRGTN